MKNKLFSKVFMWMFLGLLTTFFVANYVSNNDAMINNIFTTNLYWYLFIIELIVVGFLSSRIYKMDKKVAATLYLLYSFLNGLTISIFFILFSINSIMFIFLLTSFIFGMFALVGYFTKIDISKYSTLLFMGLIGIIISSIINMFIGNTTFELFISWITIILFVGITAYDIQKIKRLSDTDIDKDNLAIISAFMLYLDFINIFINLLRLFGNRGK